MYLSSSLISMTRVACKMIHRVLKDDHSFLPRTGKALFFSGHYAQEASEEVQTSLLCEGCHHLYN
jgi:hypothetical protein